MDAQCGSHQVQQPNEEQDAEWNDYDKVGDEAGNEPEPASLWRWEKPARKAHYAFTDEARSTSCEIGDCLEHLRTLTLELSGRCRNKV